LNNVYISIIQVTLSTIVIFILYKYLIGILGANKFGLWSLITSVVSLANVVNLGFSASVTSYVAKFQANNEEDYSTSFLETTFISAALIVGFFLILFYPVSCWVISHQMNKVHSLDAIEILPYACISFWITILLNILFSGLDGIQKLGIRSSIQILGIIVNLILCFLLVPRFGIIGLAYSQLIQSVFMLVLSILFVRKYLPKLPFLPYRFNKELFILLIKYSTKFQLIPLSQMFCEPITKLLLTRFGGLSAVSYFDMANRMLLQLRLLFVSAGQALLPLFAEQTQKSKLVLFNFYKESVDMISFLSISVFLIIIGFLPLISKVWIGHSENMFVLTGVFLSIGFFINALGIPAYYLGIGSGNLKWIINGHLLTAVFNIILSYIFGIIFGYLGVIMGWVLSWIIGTLFFAILQDLNLNVIKIMFSNNNLYLISSISLFSLISIFFNFSQIMNVQSILLIGFSFAILVCIPVWLHPMRSKVVSLISNKFN